MGEERVRSEETEIHPRRVKRPFSIQFIILSYRILSLFSGTTAPTSEDTNKIEEETDSSESIENSQQTDSSDELTGEEITQNDLPTDVPDFPGNIEKE